MSLYGMMKTGASGMNAQATRLGTVADNIANANTTGYKRASTEFSSLVLPSSSGSYTSGAVNPNIRYAISQEGSLLFTTSKTDLGIRGDGFFVVSDPTDTPYLTRAGSFVENGDGFLVNAAGYTLTGYPFVAGEDPTVVINGFEGVEPINLRTEGLTAEPSTSGSLGANLPNNAAVGDLETTSLVVFDSQGDSRILDFTYEKTAANSWTISAVDRDTGTSVLAATNMDFDVDGQLIDVGGVTAAPFNVTTTGIPGLPTGADLGALTIDLTRTTQLGYPFSPDGGSVDGNPPSKVVDYQISSEGVVFVQYENGNLDPRYRIAMASVQSPDNLVPLTGNVYAQGVESGVIVTGFAGTAGFGEIVSGALEASNVDIANELTSMIESQRSYTANSRSFQAGSDLLEVLVNLGR